MATMLILKAMTGELRGQEFVLTGPLHCVLGRSRGCALRLPGDATVSRQHCLLEMDGTGVWAQDLGSLNGTFVNGQRIGQRGWMMNEDATMLQPARQALRDGDELRICNHIFYVQVAEGPAGPAKKKGDTSDEWPMALSV
jgi:pSer/pThr/pTyr-binding forkhead associated (FHA) protein